LKTPKQLLIEEKTGKDIKDLLYELYVKKDLSLKKTSEYLRNKVGVEVSTCTLYYWLLVAGIPTRAWLPRAKL